MIDSSRRTVLTTGAAAAAATAAPQVFAQAPPAGAVQGLPAGAKVGFYEKGNVRIRYAEIGSGFPLLATPGGGLNSAIAVWARAVINIPEEFKNDFRVITMDQRNATGGESTGPVPVDDPWGAFASDQLGVMDHLGIDKFFFFGNCIGGPFAMKLMERAPQRVVAAILSQPVGHKPEKPDYITTPARRSGARSCASAGPTSRRRRSRSICTIFTGCGRTSCTACRANSRSRARRRCWCCPTMWSAHPLQTSIDIASLCPNAEITVYPWKEPADLKARTINRARTFLKRRQTA